jgi:ATPase subunit of ABC transporter with duplicated ATPase domains
MGHSAIICHNGKRLNAKGQVASATAPNRAAWTSAAFEEFQEFKRAQEQQQQRHQQQQQEQGDKCAQIAAEFDRWNISNSSVHAITEVVECNNVNACNPTPPLFLHLKPVGKLIFRVKVLADTGATRSLISLSTANKHRCEIRETDLRLSAANRTKIDMAGTTFVEKGQLVHTIVAIVSPNVQQTIVGWQHLKAMGVIASDWPAMLPPPTTKDTI